MPPTIRSCLNSWGDCGSAYQLPGRRPTGTRKSRAPSGVDLVRYGALTLAERAPEQVRRPPADAKGAGGLLAADVQVAVLDPDVLVDLGVALDRERQRI